MKKKKCGKFLLLLMPLLMIASVVAAGEITQDASKLNYWTADSLVVTVQNTATIDTNVSIASPWTVTATDGVYCTNAVNDITCILSAGQSGTYTVTADASVGEYATQAFAATTNNSYTAETVTFVRMQDSEILRTLIEYGRGRGNYFYDSGSNNAKKGVQCSDLPADTAIELNYLHKIYPVINNYLNLPAAEGSNLTLTCQYPNMTVVKQHLASDVDFNGAVLNVNYSSDWLKTSWEKVFFLVQDFDSTDKTVGDTIVINCSSMEYYLSDANGWVTVSLDDMTLTFRNATPMQISAVANPTQIGTGTSEVEITYTITNSEAIDLSASSNPITIDIKAPAEAVFIGTRGELWGTGQQIYHYELNSLGANEAVNITLVARYTTTGAGTVNLCSDVSVAFVPCWQVNAYNPLVTEQTIACSDTLTVNVSSVAVTNIISEITNMQQDLANIEAKIDVLNATSNNIYTIVSEINSTVWSNNADLQTIIAYVDTLESGQTTIIGYVDTLEAGQATIFANLTTIINNQQEFKLNFSTLYSFMIDMNNTLVNSVLTEILNNQLYINNTYNYVVGEITNRLTELNVTTQDTKIIVTAINTTTSNILIDVQNINTTVTDIQVLATAINGTVVSVENIVTNINTTTNDILSLVTYINSTKWSNITAQDLLNAINSVSLGGVSTKIDALTTNLRQLEEFQEESIYLITDSITEGQQAYTEAMIAAQNGENDVAVMKLQESIDSLNKADRQILEAQAAAEKDKLNTISQQNPSFIKKVIMWLTNLFK